MLPENIPTVTVTGRYLLPDGTPLAGQVVWRAPALITFPDADVMLSGPVTAKLDATGAFAVELPATDAPGMNPAGWAYTVTEQLTGTASNRSYSVLLPAESPDVDLADLAPTDPTTPNYVAVRGASAYEVAVADGYTGTVTQWLDSLVGAVGPKGDTGPAGATGPAGPEGASAYEVAVADGYTGTEAEWLASLKGEKGDPGAGSVSTVNGDPGPDVLLDAAKVGALPDTGVVEGGNLYLDIPTADYRTVTFRTGAVNRWIYGVTNAPETGADAGSDFELANHGDDGAWKSSFLYGKRSTGQLGIGTSSPLTGARATIDGAAGLVDVATDPAAPAGGALLYSKSGKAYVRQSDGTVVPLAQAPASTRNVWTPQAVGFQAWSVDPAGVANPAAKAAVVKRIYMSGINITEPTPANRVVVFARGWAGSTAVPAARFYAGIYNESGARVATSGQVSSLPAAGQLTGTAPGAVNNHIGAVPVPLTATVTLQPGRYWCAFLVSAGSATDFYYMHVQNEAPSSPSNFFLGSTFQRAWAAAGDAYTSLPTSLDQSAGEVGIDPAIMALALV